MKTRNDYQEVLGRVYTKTPKAVLAAIAVSALTSGGDYLEYAQPRLIGEWWMLYDNRIIPQKPPYPRPAETPSEDR